MQLSDARGVDNGGIMAITMIKIIIITVIMMIKMMIITMIMIKNNDIDNTKKNKYNYSLRHIHRYM